MKFLLLILIVMISPKAHSQDSLLNYLDIAIKNNPSVMQKYTEYIAALQKIPQVGSLPDPEVTAGIFLSPMELLVGNQVAEIKIMQMFPWFGVLKNAKDEMSLMAKAKYESFRDTRLQISFDIQRTWYELLKIGQEIRISEKNIEILRTLERLSLVKFRSVPISGGNTNASDKNMSGNSNLSTSPGSSGMNSMGGNSVSIVASNSNNPTAMRNNSMETQTGSSGLAELYRIQIETGELENNIALLKNQQSTVTARFNAYLNRSVKTPVYLPDTIRKDTLNMTVAAVSDSMLSHHPMLGMLTYEQLSLEARKKMVTRMGYPMFGIGINYSLINKKEMSASTMNGKDMIMPMFTVTLPIYRKKYKSMQTEADLLKTATQQSFQASANSLQTEYYEALQLYQDADRRMKLYENQSMLAKKSLDIMVKSFSVSETGLTDVLRIQQQLLDYDNKKAEAITDYNISVAWLKRLGSIETL